MNKDSVIDFLGFIAVKAVGIVFRCLPLSVALWIGRCMGGLALVFNVRRRSIAYANLKSAFPEKDSREIKRILKSHYRNLGMSIVELLKLPAMGKRYLDRHVEFSNFDRIEKALEKGRGVILLSGHFGNWEVSSLAVNSRGRNISVFAREQKYTRLNNLLNKYRGITGGKVIAKGFSIREIVKTLRNNGIIGMLADQDAGPKGIFVNFLNRPASMPQGPVIFSLKTGAKIISCFIRRENYDRHIIEIGRPMELVDTGDKDKDIKENLKKVANILEGYIKKDPNQWLWSHKRWKSTPQRTVLVLSDGKAGHLNQAMAVAEMIEEALGSRLKARDITEKPIVKVKVIEVKFKNKITRMLSDLASFFAGRRCQGCMRCAKFCLKKETFDQIKNHYADIIISCGASTVGINAFLKYENNAKGIVIMKPGLGRSGKFDMIVMPRHDAGLSAKTKRNVLITDIAPNRIIQVHKCTSAQEHKGVGLLIGGEAKNFKLIREDVETVVDGALKAAEETGRDIFLTTSRRTSPEIDSFLKDKLAGHKRCKLLVTANEDNPEGTVQKILEASEVVIVSPESISMISEAVSSGKYVVVFTVHKCTSAQVHKNKYEKSILNLQRQGYIKVTSPDKIYGTVKETLFKKPQIRISGDRVNIIKRLEGIV